jgi:hypothetical protein
VQGLKPEHPSRHRIAAGHFRPNHFSVIAWFIFLLSKPGLESNFPKSHLSAGQLKQLFLVTFHLFLFVFLLFALPDR